MLKRVDQERRYFFHVRDGVRLIRDPEGQCFEDLASAKTEAILDARELMSHSIVGSARIGLERRIEIADEKGRTILVVPFFEAVEPLPGYGISRPTHHEALEKHVKP
jgi:hypothetical protein